MGLKTIWKGNKIINEVEAPKIFSDPIPTPISPKGSSYVLHHEHQLYYSRTKNAAHWLKETKYR